MASFIPISADTCQSPCRCRRAPCFQVRLEARSHPRPVRRSGQACASHIVDLVQTLTSWAHEHDLSCGQITVLAIERRPNISQPHGAEPPPALTRPAFPFSTIPL